MPNFAPIEEFFQDAARGDAAAVRAKIKSGISPNARDNGKRTALHWASQENQCEVVNCLLEHGADIDAQDEHGFTPLVTAAGEGHSLLVTLLLDKGADPNRRIKALEDGTALHSACAYGHLDAVQALLRDDRIEINAKDSNGKRPLDYARAGKFRLIVHQMTQRGAV